MSSTAQVSPGDVPRIDALPQPQARVPSPASLDLGALARGFDRGAPQGLSMQAHGPRLLIFVSLAMPEATLARLVDQATRFQATLMLRGLINGSLRETVARVQALIGKRPVEFQIDPLAFDRYGIERTPSFVLLAAGVEAGPCSGSSCGPGGQADASTHGPGVARVAGDVSVDYALEFFRRNAPAVARDAQALLAKALGR